MPYIDDDNVEIPDGGRVRVPIMTMDAKFDARDHQPGFRYASDAAVRDARRRALDAREAMIRRAERAWCDARQKRDDDDDVDDDDANSRERSRDARDARAVATASYIAMCARLRDAWRSSPSDGAGGPDADALLARHLRGDEPDDDDDDDNGNNNVDLREQSYAAYKDQLENAWRGGRTDPRRAVEIERRLERERGKYA
jgi:hypothetical protein